MGLLDWIAPETANAVEALKMKRLLDGGLLGQMDAQSRLLGTPDTQGNSIMAQPMAPILPQSLQQFQPFQDGASSPMPPPYQGPVQGSAPPPMQGPTQSAGMDGPQLLGYAQQRRGLLDGAFPQAAAAQLQARAFPAPIGKLNAGESFFGAPDQTGKAPMYAQAPPLPTDFQRDLAAGGLKPGSPEYNAAVADKIKKDSFIPELDPNKVAEMKSTTQSNLASVTEKAASTKLAEARAKALADNAITDDAVEFRAQLALAGDTDSAFKGLPSGMLGSAARAKVTDRWASLAQENNVGGDEMNKIRMQQKAANAALGQVAKRAGAADYNANEMSIIGGQLESASKAVDRVGWTDLNNLTNFAKSHTSNPEYGQLDVAVQGFKTAFAQALSRNGVPTDQGRAKADALFSGARSHADLMARVAQAQKEAGGVIQAGDVTKKQILDGVGGSKSSNPQAAPDAPKVRVWNPQTGRLE